jgi:DNA-binding response OmpR family regulator
VVHRELLKKCGGYMDTGVYATVDHAIVRLRRRRARPAPSGFIRTVHGDGYCLSAQHGKLTASSTEVVPGAT